MMASTTTHWTNYSVLQWTAWAWLQQLSTYHHPLGNILKPKYVIFVDDEKDLIFQFNDL